MPGEVPLYPLATLLFLAAAAVFTLRMARHLRVFAAAQPAAMDDQPGFRFRSLLVYSIAQVRMFRDLQAGLMHAAIFWGFVILTVGTANRVFFGLIEAVVRPWFGGLLWGLLLLGQNLLAISVLGAVGYAIVRRTLVRPRRLTLSLDGLRILLLIAGVVATELLAEAFRLAHQPDDLAAWSVVAAPLGGLFGRLLPVPVLDALFALSWWANIGIVCFFLVYLPRSKHLHIATSFFNALFRKVRPRGELPPMDLEAETARFGVKTIEDLSWKDLLDGFTCTECGRCQDACPAWATGKPLNPKTLIMGLREMSVEAEAGMPLLPFIAPRADGDGRALNADALARPVVDSAIPYDAVWDCVTCGACVEACPVLIEHVDKIVGLRRNLVLEESRFPAELTAAFT
ncbi:MAG TPA: (Fe-S)-binding protein, partial [Candidatus Limnocylindrales bacterium]|nr:(Fe-S)-binding protein [Candidatus Limnocylindrales bacterium]